MLGDAKVAAPSPLASALRQPVWERVDSVGAYLFAAPPGYLVTDCLVATLAERSPAIVWLRLGVEDTDPAVLLRSLVHAAQRVAPQVGLLTLEQMRRRLGPLSGWSPLFSLLGQEMAEQLPAHTSLVIENLHLLHNSRALVYLGADWLPYLRSTLPVIWLSEQPLKRDELPSGVTVMRVDDTPLTEDTAIVWATTLGFELTRPLARRLIQHTQGRAEAILTICRAGSGLGSATVLRLIERSRGQEVMNQLADLWLAATPPDAQPAQATLAYLGYSHPALLTAIDTQPIQPGCPWLLPLAEDWVRLRPGWRLPLQSALRVPASSLRALLSRVATMFVEHDAAEYAVPIYHDLGDNESVAATLSKVIDPWMADGRWETLVSWIQRLPPGVRERRPWLGYTLGEIAAGKGELGEARRHFSTAAACFDKLHEGSGACQSWLAESALSVWQDDLTAGLDSALRALTLARQGDLVWYQCWANWQLACLKGEMDQLDEAQRLLHEAQPLAATLNDRFLNELLRLTERIIQQRYDLQRQREYHRRAYHDTLDAEQTSIDRLRLMLRLPTEHNSALLDSVNWSHTPLAAKLAAPKPAPLPPDTPPGLFSAWLGRLFGRQRRPPVERLPAQRQPPTWQATMPDSAPTMKSFPATPTPDLGNPMPVSPVPALPAAPRPTPASSGAPSLTVHLLGVFKVNLNNQPIEDWPNNIPQRLFKYLIAHHPRPVKRDLLAREFWPREDEERAKRNLDTNLSILRRLFKAHGVSRIDQLRDDEYTLSSSLEVWVDVSEFERRVQAGNRFYRQAAYDAAAREYEAAIQLYQGDFLAETPYEAWPVRFRDRYKVYYCEAVERLCQFYFGQEQYAQCGRLCHLYLERDNCRQDIHHLLMRCYQRMGQRTLALQQYQKCVDALRRLNATPDKALTELYQQLCQSEAA